MIASKKTCCDCRHCVTQDYTNVIGKCTNPNLRQRNIHGEPQKTVRLFAAACKDYEPRIITTTAAKHKTKQLQTAAVSDQLPPNKLPLKKSRSTAKK